MMERVQIEENYRRSPPICAPKKICLDSKAFAISTSTHQNGTVGGKKHKKSVTFHEVLEERIEFEDDVDSKTARKLYWEFMAADRVRFKDRIERIENVLSPILTTAHRNMIYAHRMGNPSLIEPDLVEMQEIEVIDKKVEI